MSRGFHLRPIDLADADALVGLSRQLGYAIESGLIVNNLRHMLENRDHCLIVAVDTEDKAVGWIHGFVRPLVESPLMVELGGLVVDRDWRGAGLGRALLDEVERWTRGQGIGILSVRSASERPEAHRFYLGQGYELIKSQQVFRKRLR
jgi:GNAT superfamily N-acetyltransferase